MNIYIKLMGELKSLSKALNLKYHNFNKDHNIHLYKIIKQLNLVIKMPFLIKHYFLQKMILKNNLFSKNISPFKILIWF